MHNIKTFGILEQLNGYITTHNLLPNYLSAYRKNFFIETILVKIHHDILKAFEEQKGILITGLDQLALCDTIDHNFVIIVLEKSLVSVGWQTNASKDYLRNRSICLSIPLSLPQGSCAGFVLYNTFQHTGEASIGLPSQSRICR